MVMKIAFPYMGTVVIYKKMLELLGHEVIVPPRPSQKTLDLGVKYSPEFACFPFKAIMGSYIQACEVGVDAIVTSGGHGPCRAGYYGEIHDRVLKRLGYDVDFIVFDSIRRDRQRFIDNLKKLKGTNSWFKVIRSIKYTYDMIQAIDKLDKKVHQILPYEKVKGETIKAWDEIQLYFELARTRGELNKAIQKSNERIDRIELEDVREQEKIKIGIVGEIYVVMESSINMEIEKVLGELGCETERAHYLSEWVDYNMMPHFLSNSHEIEVMEKGKPFIEIEIGGHAQQTVGQIVDFKERGFDGIIHLMPFGCLPELVSQSVIPKISQQYEVPVLTLSLDEQTGQANSRTRIEAFIDLIKNKKISKFTA